MLIKTLLNKCYPVKEFIYGKVVLYDTKITVKVKERSLARQNGRAGCLDSYYHNSLSKQLREV